MNDLDDYDGDSTPLARARQRSFLPVALGSPIEREGATYALRMIDGLRWYGRLWDRNGVRDHEMLTLLGLEINEEADDSHSLREFCNVASRQLRRLEPKLRRDSDLLARNVDKIGDLLKLNVTERAILRLALVTTRVGNFASLFGQCVRMERDLMRAIQLATGCKLRNVRTALEDSRILRRSGFFEVDGFAIGFQNPLELNDEIAHALLTTRFNEARLLRHLLRAAPASTLTLDDFAHLPELDLIQGYLRSAVARRRKGVNVLLYGAPGTGKTEFARALAPALETTLHEVPNEDSDRAPVSGSHRFNAYSVCQNLLAHRRRQILLFDEVEDVFGGGDDSPGGMFGVLSQTRNPERLRKSWVNETLETNPVPALWACNSIRAIDPAFLRRFDLVIEFRTPTRALRRRQIDRYFRRGEISSNHADRLARMEHLPPAVVERAARVVRSLRTRDLATRDAQVERVVTATLRAMGHNKSLAATGLPAHYDPAFLNTDRDLDAITRGLGNGIGARLCLYGPPGTGKTAFAHHLGSKLDRPVIVKRASDLLSKWVGESEGLLADAFARAQADSAILVIDEADGFLRDRSNAQRTWEVTCVNELLTQMEAFEGIFIASTNLIDTLDPASLRRFDFKVKFDYLTREQRRAMLLRVAADADEAQDQPLPALIAIDRLEQLTPGDFANVLRQLRVTGEVATATRVAQLLADEAAMKPEGARQARIGFVT